MADERPAVGVRFAEPVVEGPFPEKNETDAFIEDERSSFDEDPEHRPSKQATVSRLNKSAIIPWILAGLFALTSFLLLLERYGIRKFGTYEDRLETDLKSLSHVPLKRRRFVGSPKFDENGTMYTSPIDPTAGWPENLKFTGEPSEEIDENWNHLLEDRYFSVSDSEAEVAWGDRRHQYVDEVYGGYTAGLDVFHTLHCLNHIRKALYPEYYDHHDDLPVEVDKAHTDHCIDTIRQHIQCYGSTTLVPTKWREGAKRQYIDSNQEHVCRDFGYLRKYMKRRSHKGDLYVSRDKKMLGMAKAWEEAWEDDGQPH
ncbi:hypothetical protein VP1G_08142 [Cytospora mali]|uniref:Cyclochlorotine biosynthesis protein O n=1 Tax=Cytospora mali TaxID=578113 RepID=A0A194VB01_CYTMA|nr:hypothetical protein VP1G_08142 [Valsa mali var. pyri (nom. inval.)]